MDTFLFNEFLIRTGDGLWIIVYAFLFVQSVVVTGLVRLLASADDDVEAFMVDEILDISEFFTSKFKLLVSYADHIVGVYEHSKGGHAWEAGYIDQPAYRDRTRAFYRIYETDEAQ